jgi:hypothetical protein
MHLVEERSGRARRPSDYLHSMWSSRCSIAASRETELSPGLDRAPAADERRQSAALFLRPLLSSAIAGDNSV